MADETDTSDIPDTLLVKLFDATGNLRGGNKGYYLFYINKEGSPACVSKSVDAATRLALMAIIKDCQEVFEGGDDD